VFLFIKGKIMLWNHYKCPGRVSRINPDERLSLIRLYIFKNHNRHIIRFKTFSTGQRNGNDSDEKGKRPPGACEPLNECIADW